MKTHALFVTLRVSSWIAYDTDGATELLVWNHDYSRADASGSGLAFPFRSSGGWFELDSTLWQSRLTSDRLRWIFSPPLCAPLRALCGSIPQAVLVSAPL